MFSIVVDQTHTVLLIEFNDLVLAQDIVDLRRLLAPIAATNAIDKVVVDLRRVTAIDLTVAELAERAQSDPALPGRKLVLVTSGGAILDFSRQLATHRASRGHGEVAIVPDLEAAWRVLGIVKPMFF